MLIVSAIIRPRKRRPGPRLNATRAASASPQGASLKSGGLGLFVFVIVETAEIVVIEFVLVLVDVDVLDLVVKLFVDVVFVLFVKIFVVEGFVIVFVVEVFVFEVVIVFEFFLFRFFLFVAMSRDERSCGFPPRPPRCARGRGVSEPVKYFTDSRAWIQSSVQGSSSGNSP